MSGTLGGALERRILSRSSAARSGSAGSPSACPTARTGRSTGRFAGPQAHVDSPRWRPASTGSRRPGRSDWPTRYVAATTTSADLVGLPGTLRPGTWNPPTATGAGVAPRRSAEPRGSCSVPRRNRVARSGHRAALRPGQRVLRGVARRDDDLLLGRLRRRAHDPGRGAAEKYRRLAAATGDRARATTCSRSGRAGVGSPSMLADEIGCHVTTVTSPRSSMTTSRSSSPSTGSSIACRPAPGLPGRARRLRPHRLGGDDGVDPRSVCGRPFFGQLRSLTKPGRHDRPAADRSGRASLVRSRTTNLDFVRRYIFPGGQVPSDRCCATSPRRSVCAGGANREFGPRTTRAPSAPGSPVSTPPGPRSEG